MPLIWTPLSWRGIFCWLAHQEIVLIKNLSVNPHFKKLWYSGFSIWTFTSKFKTRQNHLQYIIDVWYCLDIWFRLHYSSVFHSIPLLFTFFASSIQTIQLTNLVLHRNVLQMIKLNFSCCPRRFPPLLIIILCYVQVICCVMNVLSNSKCTLMLQKQTSVKLCLQRNGRCSKKQVDGKTIYCWVFPPTLVAIVFHIIWNLVTEGFLAGAAN